MTTENNPGAVAEGTPAGTAQVDGGQGAGGEGAGQQEPNYAGFKSVEELTSAYEKTRKDVEELSSLKGRFGNELGQLRAEKARLEGMVQGIQASRVPSGPVVTVADLDARLAANEITLPDYLRQRDALRERELEQKVEQKLKQEIGGFQSEVEKQKYIDRFVSENPGYIDAFNKGDLSPWLDRGMSGEDAWTQYRLKQVETERDTLRKQIEEQTNKARQEGIQAGTKIEAGKQAAGKVLGGGAGGGASFGQGNPNPPLRSHSERVQAGVALLNRMQSGGS